MANMSPRRVEAPEQDPQVRIGNFDEVCLGYTPEMAKEEAARCLNCPTKPCTAGCPVNVHIPDFIRKIAAGEFDEAYKIIVSTNNLPAVCGRVCPQETQCEARCIRGKKGDPVAIGKLERFASDWHAAHGHTEGHAPVPESNGHKVAIIGSGPAGLACAADLARGGFDVTIFEASHKPGGVLVYGIPEFRLPKSIVDKEIQKLSHFGVKLVKNAVIGRAVSVDDLFDEGFEAVFIGSGAGLPQFMHIPGEQLTGVYTANEYLTRINLMKAYRPEYDTPIALSHRVAVIGGGNVAMDAARCAKRMGAENVYIVYRRSMEELPARAEEVNNAQEEGIIFRLLTSPVAIEGDENGRVTGLECVEMELGEPDASGRRRPVEKQGSNFLLPVDAVIIAIGTTPNPLIEMTTDGLEVNRKGCIVTDEKGATSREGVFAGGDAVTGSATVILAMGAGRSAATAIKEYIESK